MGEGNGSYFGFHFSAKSQDMTVQYFKDDPFEDELWVPLMQLVILQMLEDFKCLHQ